MGIVFVTLFSLFTSQIETSNLIEKMSHRSWKVRETATKELVKKKAESINQLTYAARKHADPEVRNRAKQIVDNYLTQLRVFSIKEKKRFAYIECLPEKFPERDFIIEKTYELYGMPWQYYGDDDFDDDLTKDRKKADNFLKYRFATQQLVRKLFWENEMSIAKIQELLDKMEETEDDWLERGGRWAAPVYPPER